MPKKRSEIQIVSGELRSSASPAAIAGSMTDVIKYLPDATFVIDIDGRVIAWNQAIEEMTGVSASEMLGQGDYAYSLPFYGIRRPILIDLVLKPDIIIEKDYFFIERTNEALIAETPTPSVRGKEAFLWGKAALLYDNHGVVIGAIESIRDVTERKQAEIDLKNSEQRLADIINFLPDATFAIDTSHRVIAWNRAIEEMTGVSAAEIMGQGDYAYSVPFYGTRRPIILDLLLEPNPGIEESYSSFRRDREVIMVETPALNIHGRETYLWAKATLLYDSQGNVVGAIESIRDLTERRQAENEKLEAQERAARAENLASLGLMATGLAHAIKQPLNSIMITIDSLLFWHDMGRKLEWDNVIEDLQKVVILSARIDEIIERVRGFIRNEQYGQLAPCDLNQAVSGALDILKAQMISHGVSLMVDLDPDLPQVLGSESRLEEVAINLLVNAMQAVEQVPIFPRIVKCSTRAGEMVVLEIADNGIGIDNATIGKIFEPLFSTKGGQGMGMGLFIVKSVISTMNGHISCQSESGQTVFRVELPPFRG